MKTMMRVSLFAIVAFALAACQPAANTNTNSNTNANTAPKAAAPTADSLMALDTKAWDAFKAKDGTFFQNYLADNFVGFGDEGKREAKAEAVKGISEHKCEIASTNFSDQKVTMAGADAAVLSYKATVDGTCEGKKIPSPVMVATVFVRSGDTWKGAYHNEVPIMEAPKPAEGSNTNAAASNKEAAGAEKKEMPESAPKVEKPVANAASTSANTNSASNANTGTSTGDALTDAMMAVERKGWEGWMKQDSKMIDETIGKDVAFVDPSGKGYFGKDAVMKEWLSGQCKVSSVDVSDGKASMINADVAILTYKGTAVGTCGDMKLTPIWGTTVAVKEGATWKAVYIFETPMRKM
jgi:ketosteroid isomerase-like protein